MKKNILVLLFSISASSLAMDAPEKIFPQFVELPLELQSTVATTGILQAKDLPEAIKIIKTRAQVNRLFREEIKRNAAQLIDFLAQKFKKAPYKVALSLGVLAEKWYRKNQYLKENESLSEKWFKDFADKWRRDEALLLKLVAEVEGNKLLPLLKKGVYPNIQNETGSTLLHMAVANKNETNVKHLLEYGADPNIQEFDMGATPLMIILGLLPFSNFNIVKMLLESGANPNMQALEKFSKMTPLKQAILIGNKDLVGLLLQYGADLTIQDESGNTILDYAKIKGDAEIVKILEEAMAKQEQY